MTTPIDPWMLEQIAHARASVEEALAIARSRVAELEVQEAKLTVAARCDHPEESWKDLGGFIYREQKCEKCGYTWVY